MAYNKAPYRSGSPAPDTDTIIPTHMTNLDTSTGPTSLNTVIHLWQLQKLASLAEDEANVTQHIYKPTSEQMDQVAAVAALMTAQAAEGQQDDSELRDKDEELKEDEYTDD